MNPKSEKLVDLIFKKLKSYNTKEIHLEKNNLKQFVSFLLKEN